MVGRGARRLRAIIEPEGPLPPVTVRRIHGYDRAYRRRGEGETLLLVHGIGDSSTTWSEVVRDLSQDHDVLAPDLLGHGFSDKPRADYSVGGFANGLRDLLTVLDIERATVVGHSLGAIVAMQFAYQFPERTERLVLVSAGGVSRSIHPVVRAATLPFAPTVMGLLDLPGIRRRTAAVTTALASGLTGGGLAGDGDRDDLLRVLEGLDSHEARMALTRTLRAVVDARGQVVTGVDRSYLAAGLPSLVLWGDHDPLIPPHHARLAHAAFPGSRLELVHGAGHFPHRSHAEHFVATLRSFMASTTPRRWDEETWRDLLLAGDGPAGAAAPTSLAAAVD